MTSPAATRIHLMITYVLVTCGAVGGAVLGLLLSGRLMALICGTAAALGSGAGALLSRRQVVACLEPDRAAPRTGTGAGTGRGDGYAEGLAGAALVRIATYQAAVFPLTPDGVSEEERRARRHIAYRISAHEGLPHPVQVSAAAALEAIDAGQDPDRADAAMKALSVTVHEIRVGR